MAGAKAQKRKSGDNQTPGKKIKLENGTPESKSPKKPFVKKENSSPQKPGNQKFNKKNKGGDGPKPFAGTKQLNDKPKVKKEKIKQEKPADGQPKKRRNPQFHKLKDAVGKSKGESDPEVVKSLEDKIKAIESRKELTKTAKRKLSLLKKLKAAAEGKILEPKKPAEKQTSTAKARRDRKKRAATEAKAAGKVKPGKQAKQDEDSDDEDDEENGAEAESSEEESVDEEAGGEGGEEEDSDDDDDDDEAGEEVEGEADSDDDDDAENGGDDDEEDDDSDEEPAPKEKQAAVKKFNKETSKSQIEEDNGKVKKPKPSKPNPVNVENLKKNEIIGKTQKRYVLFIGNIPYDTTKADLQTHFSKVGEIMHVRLPLDQKTNRPRGFGYIEVKDEETYQKCLSMHHSQIQGRRINVLYTQGGNKNSENQKKEIKAKNMKLHAMRIQGKLAGSTKQSNKRTFRRNKGKNQEKTDQ